MNLEAGEQAAMARARWFTEFLSAWRWLILAVILILAAGSVYLMKDIRSDNSDESFFLEDDPAVIAIHRFRELFGNEDYVYVAVRPGGDVFERSNMLMLKSLADALEKDVPFLREVKWLGSAEYIRPEGDHIAAGPGLEKIPDDQAPIDEFKAEVLKLNDFVNVLVSPDSRIATIVLECERYPDNVKDPRKLIAPAVEKVLQRPEFAKYETHLAGTPVQDYESDRITARETLKLVAVCLIIQSVLLFMLGNGIRAVLAPVLVILLSIIMTMGIISLAGWKVSMMDIMLPTMLFSVCLGDTVHIVASYHLNRINGMPHGDALTHTIRSVFIPCLFTSLTTMMGFMSFLATDIAPIRMAGVYSAIGVGLAFILSITLTPIIYSIHPETGNVLKKERHSRFLNGMGRALEKLTTWSIDHAYFVIFFFVGTGALGVWLYQSVVIETNTIKDIRTSEKLRQDYDFFDSDFGGSMSLDIMADSGKENGARKLTFLQDVERLQRYTETLPGCVKTHSLVDIIRRINFVLHEGRPENDVLPSEQKNCDEYLFFYETSGGKNLDRELSFLSDVARIHVQTRNMGTQEVKAFIRNMDNFVANELQGRLKVEYTGQMAFVSDISDYVSAGQADSFLCALISICAMMMICLRSVKLGLLSMLPNIVPILIPMGLMGVLGFNMSIVLMIFSSVIIGVTVDDTTHFYVTFKRFFREKHDYHSTLLKTVDSVGHPVVFTSVSLVLGFLLFELSVVRTTGQFGLLGAAAFFWGCLADLTFSPALLYVFRAMGKAKK